MPKEAPASNAGKNGHARAIDRLDWRANMSAPIEVYWSEVPDTLMRLAVDAVSRAGGALMFGRTRDGGALSIMVLQDNDKLKAYPHTGQEAQEYLERLVDEYTS